MLRGPLRVVLLCRSPRPAPSRRRELTRARAGAQNLQAHVLIQRPENVREFMIEYLSKMKQDEEGVFDPELVPSSLPAIFEEKDMVTIFGQFDVNGSGSISAAQCKSALENMGIEASEMPELSEATYSQEAFLALAAPAVAKKTAL